ncbi:MAG: cell division protein FtsL [Chromatiales bacterium]|jgi:cell division protein FtsL|nr:cell division protein FtsL [Chromatiales bacterium]
MKKNVHKIYIVLALAVMCSALAVVYTKHHSRQLFIELEALKSQRDDLDIEWNRLMLEQATWATPTRIEAIARDRLQMTLPQADKIVIVGP